MSKAKIRGNLIYRVGPHRVPLYALLGAGGFVALLLLWHALRLAEKDFRVVELGLLGLLVLVLSMIASWWQRAAVLLTEDTLVIEPGFPGAQMLEVPLRLVSRVEIVRTQLGERLGFATVIFRFKTTPEKAIFPLLPDPERLATLIRQHRDVVDAVVERHGATAHKTD